MMGICPIIVNQKPPLRTQPSQIEEQVIILMRKIAVLAICILLYASVVPIVAETPEIAEARIAGENDANGFNWQWFAAAYVLSNASPCILIPGIWVSDKFHLYDGTIDTIFSCCLATYGISALVPITVARLHSPSPPADRLLGKSPEWANAYTKAYQKGMKRYRTDASVVGCIAGTGAMVATLFLSAGVFSSSGNIGDAY